MSDFRLNLRPAEGECYGGGTFLSPRAEEWGTGMFPLRDKMICTPYFDSAREMPSQGSCGGFVSLARHRSA